MACLAESYRARIGAIEALIKAQEAARAPDRALCQRVVDAYKSAIAANPHAFFDKDPNKPGMASSPIEVLEKTPGAGFKRAKPVAELSDATRAAVERWAKKQKPSIKMPKNVIEAIFEDEPTMLTIDRAPGTDYYSASSVQGTAHCIFASYFEVKDGAAFKAGAPSFGEDSCGADQFFGSIDGKAVAIEESNNFYQPSIDDTLTIAAWDKDFFRAPCVAEFNYEPAFADMEGDNAEAPEEKCETAICKALKPQARALIEAVQAKPINAREGSLDKLTPAQRKTFDEMEKLAPRNASAEPMKPEEAANPGSYRDDDPLHVALVHDNEVYLASVGHTTMGWRTFADWSAKLEHLEKGALKAVGTVYISMTPGKLRSATVR